MGGETDASKSRLPLQSMRYRINVNPSDFIERTMSGFSLKKKGQVVIPAEIRARSQATSGAQLDFVDEGGEIRLLMRRRATAGDPTALPSPAQARQPVYSERSGLAAGLDPLSNKTV